MTTPFLQDHCPKRTTFELQPPIQLNCYQHPDQESVRLYSDFVRGFSFVLLHVFWFSFSLLLINFISDLGSLTGFTFKPEHNYKWLSQLTRYKGKTSHGFPCDTLNQANVSLWKLFGKNKSLCTCKSISNSSYTQQNITENIFEDVGRTGVC